MAAGPPNKLATTKTMGLAGARVPRSGELGAASRRARRIEAFHPACRPLIRDLACGSRQLEDLADSFPALLFALATNYGAASARSDALALVVGGAPLRAASDSLDLPFWLRKLPAQAFTAPLPQFPRDPEFALRISSLIPADPQQAAPWLQRVAHAQVACGPAYALWMARHAELDRPSEDFLMYLAAWAWFCGQSGLLGHRLLRRPWTPDISFKRARDELTAWRLRLRLIDSLGPGIECPWLEDGTAGGFEFVALRTVDDFITESEALDNCLDQYADQLRGGETAVFSIRKAGRRVACVEIGLHREEVSMPAIVQLRAARNRRAPPEVWQATFSWLGQQRLELFPRRHIPKLAKRRAARRAFWSPYLATLQDTPYLQRFTRLVLGATPRSRTAGAAATPARGAAAAETPDLITAITRAAVRMRG